MSGPALPGGAARTASRYAALGIGIVGFAGLVLALTLFFWARREESARFHVESYHLRSASLAGRLSVELTGLRSRMDDLETLAPPPTHLGSPLRPSLAALDVTIGELEFLEHHEKDSEFSWTLATVAARIGRLASAVDRLGPRELEAAEMAFDSATLAVEQLRRLHTIEMNRHVQSMEASAGRRDRTVALVAFLFAAAVISVGLQVLRRLRRTMTREDELRSSLEHLRRNEQRTIKMEALGRLAGGVAHDFNNLLTVILGHTEEIESSLGPASPMRPEAQGIQRAIGQAVALVRQLLTFSRSESSEPSVVDLNELIRQMELLLSRLLGGRSVLTTNLSPGLGPVLVDPREMERVLVNLVSNAGDAMPHGGTVTIETANTRGRKGDGADPQAETDARDFVRLSVCDLGTGMDEGTQERVFEPFFTTKPEPEGTGLGLATVHGIVKKTGGWIEIESEVEIGTRIDVYLPRHEGEPGDEVAPEDPDPLPQPSETILLVDDEIGILRSCARMLRGAGYRVLESADGATALELCGSHHEPIDLILTDVIMPGMTGPELIDRAKRAHPEARVLFMSGHAPDGSPLGGVLLRKPFRREELLSQVRSSLS